MLRSGQNWIVRGKLVEHVYSIGHRRVHGFFVMCSSRLKHLLYYLFPVTTRKRRALLSIALVRFSCAARDFGLAFSSNGYHRILPGIAAVKGKPWTRDLKYDGGWFSVFFPRTDCRSI